MGNYDVSEWTRKPSGTRGRPSLSSGWPRVVVVWVLTALAWTMVPFVASGATVNELPEYLLSGCVLALVFFPIPLVILQLLPSIGFRNARRRRELRRAGSEIGWRWVHGTERAVISPGASPAADNQALEPRRTNEMQCVHVTGLMMCDWSDREGEAQTRVELALARPLPMLDVRRRSSVARGLPHGSGDVPLESEQFDRAFSVFAHDRRFASAFLSPEMMQHLMVVDVQAVEIHGSKLVVCFPLLGVDEWVAVAQWSERLPSLIPGVAWGLRAP